MRMIPVRTLRDLWRDRRGNLLMIFAFSVLPITFATGMGIDYAAAMRLQTRLNAVTDAAALAAVTAPMMKRGMDAACTAARSTYESQSSNIAGLSIDTRQAAGLTIAITDSYSVGSPVTVICPAAGSPPNVPATLPLSRSATVTYAARSANSFAGILGKASLGIGGNATSKTTVAPFIDIYVALDTSQSMGLAATPADEARLWKATLEKNGRGCQFGCHARDPRENYSMEEIARMIASDGKPVAKMRVDVLRDATIDMIESAREGQGTGNFYRFGLYRIGEHFQDPANVIAPLSTDLLNARAKVSGLELGPNLGDVGYGDTNFDELLDNLKPMMSARGDGTTPQTPRAFLFIVTDGVQDLCWNSHCTSVLKSAKCQQYKDAGITVGIVYTTYLPVKEDPLNPNNNNLKFEYNWLIKPLPPETIRPALQACASPGWFFEGSDAATIHTAMTNLFRQATQTPTMIR